MLLGDWEMHNRKGTYLSYWALLLVFIGCALVAQHYKLYLFFDIRFEFVSVFYLAIIRLFGYKKALISVLIISTFGFITGSDSVFLLLSIVEVLFVGGLYHWKGKKLLTWDALFLIVIWVPFYYVVFSNSIGIEEGFSSIILFRFLINGLINALLADVIADYLPRFPLIKNIFANKKRLEFGQIISQITIIAAMLPMFIFTLINGSYEGIQVEEKNTNEISSYVNQIEEKVNAMDRDEIQNLKMESIVQKAHFKQTFDNLTDQNNILLYAVDDQNSIFAYSGSRDENDAAFNIFDNGYILDVNDEVQLWLPNERNNLIDWSNGYYFSTLSIQNINFYIIKPLDQQVISIATIFNAYFITILFLFLVAVIFAAICNRVLSKSLLNLTVMTSNLPKQMESNEADTHYRSLIHEFASLGENFEKAVQKLRQMFLELKQTNALLTERTKQLTLSKDKLNQLAHFDGLTGLSNRYTFNQDIQETLLDATQNELQFAIVFIDLDEFKQVNDKIGHSGGDQLLQKIAQRLIKFSDEKVTSYRLGGDEFVVIIKNTNQLETENICFDLMRDIRKPMIIQERSFVVSASMGVSLYPDDGDNVEKILNNADTAMYRIKDSGRNGVDFFQKKED